MKRISPCLVAIGCLLLAAASHAQQNVPHVGYVYPAGGRQGETFRVSVGGQFIERATDAYLSGPGVAAKVVECTKALTPKEIDDLRTRAESLRKKPKDADAIKQLRQIGEKLAEVQNRRMNPGLAEKVTLQITLAADAEPGPRDLRLAAPNGLSNALVFQVGQLAEFRRPDAKPVTERPGGRRPFEPKRSASDSEMQITLPAVVNGQIMPAGVDRYRFQARRGQRLVVMVTARELRPYLADAVPGWFQAAVSIRDPKGGELAYADHDRFRPDPVLACHIPKDGPYTLEIRDTLYRGREDFVYRVAIGELPYVTDVFPLGGPAGEQTPIELKGWNLRTNKLTVDGTRHGPGVISIAAHNGLMRLNRVPFALDDLPERSEEEPNDRPSIAQALTLPVIVNGRIGKPGDCDVFRFDGHQGQRIIAEVDARRLGSPLDSILRLTDASGRQLAVNDDCSDETTGLLTHHADSLIAATLPADGAYYLLLADVQQKGGPEYAYRLRLSGPRPDFALLIVPSSITVRAGASAKVTVHAIRKEGFGGDIAVALKDAPKGFALSGGRLPAGQTEMRLTLSAPPMPTGLALALRLEGRATIGGRSVIRQAIAAEDMTQAFAYHHLVPAETLLVSVIGRGRLPWKLLSKTPIRLLQGGTARVQFSMPRGPFLDKLQLTLHEPPAGIVLENVSLDSAEASLTLKAEPNAKLGLKGNLIVDAAVERTLKPASGKGQGAKRLVPLGSLPAIPFEVVPSKPNDSQTTSR
ncbi:MAG: PPC domain-containing protein [Thermoguttaceae bacterium]